MYAVTIQSWRRLVLRIVIPFGVLTAIFVVWPILFDGLNFHESVRWFPWSFYLGLIAFLLAFLFVACPLIGYFRAKRQGVLGPNHFGLSPEGIRVESPKGQSLVYWSAVKRMAATKSRFFLFFGPVNALVLPRRAFESQAGFEAAQTEARVLLTGRGH